MTLQKVPKELGGVPTPDISDEDKALIADGAGGYYWGNQTAAIPTINADDVVFDNSEANIPNEPTEVQTALVEAYRKIPATKITKLADDSGGSSDIYRNFQVIREDGQIVHLGGLWDDVYGGVVQGNLTSSSWSIGAPIQVSLPEHNLKVHSSVRSRLGFFAVASDVSPGGMDRSQLWATGREMGTGVANLQVNTYTKVHQAGNAGEKISYVYSNSHPSAITNVHMFTTDDGKLHVTGNRQYYQLGTGVYNATPEYSFVISSSGYITYVGNQKVTRAWSTGLSSWAEVLVDSTAPDESKVYKLVAVGSNHVGQLGVNFVGISPGAVLNSVATWTLCKTSTNTDVQSVGGPFKEVCIMDDTNNQPSIAVITNAGELYRAGRGVGAIVYTNFTLVDTEVKHAAIVGGYWNNLLYWKETSLDTNGTLKGVGQNLSYQLGTGANAVVGTPIQVSNVFGPSNRVVDIYGTGVYGNFFVTTEDGKVYSCGNNDQSGLGTFTEAPDYEGTSSVVSWRQVLLPEPIVVDGIRTIATSGFKTTYFLGQSGALYSVGGNEFGQMGFTAGFPTLVGVPTTVPIPNGYWISGH